MLSSLTKLPQKIIKRGTSPLSMDPGLTTSPNQLPDLTDIIFTMYIDVN